MSSTVAAVIVLSALGVLTLAATYIAHRREPKIPRKLTDAEIDELATAHLDWRIGDDNLWHNDKTGETMERHWTDD